MMAASTVATETSLCEKLADVEHESWSRWMRYLFSKCTAMDDGSLVIPVGLVLRWMRQSLTPYQDLSEQEKDNDRKEVDIVLAVLDEME